jgi:DHA1 family bicyclomycin/chloramphenicol resistance-like MFS transporter
VGAAGPRVVCIAIVRDLYAGRAMAKIMSFVMTVFTLVPAAAPLLGAAIIALAGWRSIFAAFVLFSLFTASWLVIRQPETHPPGARRPLRLGSLGRAVAEVFSRRIVVLSTAAQTLAFGNLFAIISTVQPVFDETFGRAATFPLWFAAIALASAVGSLINASLVERLGMRRIAGAALAAQVAASWAAAAAFGAGAHEAAMGFAIYVAWIGTLFFCIGLTIGNLNALAMEPMGHIAGLAASVIGAISTVLAVAIAAPVGLLFDGTPTPIALGVGVGATLALLLVRMMREGVAEARA